jgi:RHS repeat-associated protein
MLYDGDGNRVAKTVGGATTYYLVDDRNLTGYAQVLEEIAGGAVQRQYTYGLDLVSQNQLIDGNWEVSFYGYDGHGGVAALINGNGLVTDQHYYDAFGSSVASDGLTPNIYLYAGEQFDPDLNATYLRSRYMIPTLGRFLTSDSYQGVVST